MNWLAPNFLFGAAALALPIALHLLRRRVVRTTPFPALRFLVASRADQRHQMLRRRIVLTLRCLALALLAAAFARPFLGAPPSTSGRATVVVIDNSFSLQSGSRWEDLRHWARSEVSTPARGDTLGLLLMNPRPIWLVAPTTDVSATLAALDALRPGWETTRAEPALRLAGDVLAAAPARERRLIFLGDQQALGWTGADFTKKLPPGVIPVFPAAAPAPASQAALSAATLTRENDVWVATVTVRNFTAGKARVVSVYAENTAACITLPLDLAASDSKTLRLPLPASFTTPPAFIRISLDPDDLPADDSVWVVPPAARAERLLLLDAASAGASADHLSTAYAALAVMPPTLRIMPVPVAAWPAAAVAIIRNDDSFAGEAATRLDAFLAGGGSALVFAEDGPAQRQWLATRKMTLQSVARPSARLRDWNLDHLLVVPLAEHNLRSLIGWEFLRAWSLPVDKTEPLAYWADGTVALGELRVGAGRVLIAGFSADRRDGDFPVQSAFVPFLHRAASYLLGLTSAATDAAARVGSTVVLPEGPGTWQALAGPAISVPKSSVSGAIQPEAPGIYEFLQPGTARHLYAVGLALEESDPAPWPSGSPWNNLISSEKAGEMPIAARLTAASAKAENQSALWWWAFAAMAVFALAELSLANRTTR